MTNLGLHGLYHVSDATSFGLFVGQEELDGETLDFYGLEFGHEMAQFEVEGYLSQVDAEGEDANGLGLMGRFAVTPQVGLSASADRLDLDGLDLTRWGLMVDYAPVDNFSLYAEIGTLDASISGASDSETFIGLGAKISFGAARGATFGDRGVFKYLPGL